MGRTAYCVVLVCALVLTGCSGFGGGDGAGSGVGASDGSGSGVSVTPAPVPEAKGSERLAPGLTDAGIENASALAAAHNAVLENTSFTQRWNTTTRYANGLSRGRSSGTIRMQPDRPAYVTAYEASGAPLIPYDGSTLVRIGRWFDGERALARFVFANGSTDYGQYSAETGLGMIRAFTDDGDRLARLLEGAETRVAERVERNGTTLYRVVATDLDTPGLVETPYFESGGNGTLEALVDSRGFVHRYRLAYTLRTENGSSIRVTESTRYARVGSTTAERPPWHDEALNRTNATGSR